MPASPHNNINSSSFLNTFLLILSATPRETTANFTDTNLSDTTRFNESSFDLIPGECTTLNSSLPAAAAEADITVIHIVALCSLSTTILISSCLLVFSCLCRNKENHSHQQASQPTKQSRESGPELTSSDNRSNPYTITTTTSASKTAGPHIDGIDNRSKMATRNKRSEIWLDTLHITHDRTQVSLPNKV